MHFRVYKVHLAQGPIHTDHAQRMKFVEWTMKQKEVDADFSTKTSPSAMRLLGFILMA